VPDESLLRRAVLPLGRLLDFRGRSRRADFWPYMGLLAGLYVLGFAIVMSGALSLARSSGIAPLFALVGILILLAFAAGVRRLHDVGWSGGWMAAYVLMGVSFIAFALSARYSLTHADAGAAPLSLIDIGPVLMPLSLAMNALFLLVFVLCLQDGMAGPNRYGPDPKGRSAP
jgi:uncharacterized membrane protein YhaH (DUF805 family)